MTLHIIAIKIIAKRINGRFCEHVPANYCYCIMLWILAYCWHLALRRFRKNAVLNMCKLSLVLKTLYPWIKKKSPLPFQLVVCSRQKGSLKLMIGKHAPCGKKKKRNLEKQCQKEESYMLTISLCTPLEISHVRHFQLSMMLVFTGY